MKGGGGGGGVEEVVEDAVLLVVSVVDEAAVAPVGSTSLKALFFLGAAVDALPALDVDVDAAGAVFAAEALAGDAVVSIGG